MVNIRGRIIARKAVFIYFYMRYFWEFLPRQDWVLDDVYQAVKAALLKEIDYSEFKKQLELSQSQLKDRENVISYVLNNFFQKEIDIVDGAYIDKIAPFFDEFKNEVEQKVDLLARSFKFEEMDIVDRAIFLLGYVEKRKVGTEPKLILNEMIELAKRYWDEGSSKLINGIGHHLIIEESVVEKNN